MNRPNSPFINLLIYEKIFFPDSTLSTVPESLIKQGFFSNKANRFICKKVVIYI